MKQLWGGNIVEAGTFFSYFNFWFCLLFFGFFSPQSDQSVCWVNFLVFGNC